MSSYEEILNFPFLGFYFFAILTWIVSTIIGTGFFVAQMAFFAKVSPKDIGGTYMTLLNTFANLGSMWVTPFAFQSVDFLTVKEKVESSSAGGGKEEEKIVVDGML